MSDGSNDSGSNLFNSVQVIEDFGDDNRAYIDMKNLRK